MLSRTFGRGAGRALGLNGAMGSVGRSVMPSVISLLLLYLGDVLGLTTFFAYMAVVSVLIYFGVKDLRRGGQQQVRKTTEKLERGFYKFLLILGALVFLRSMFITGTATFLGEFEYQIYLSKTLAGIFLTVGFAGSIVGQPVFGWLTERLGGRTSFALSSVMSVLFFALFLLSVRNLYLSATAYTLFTFAAYTGFPVLLGYVSQVFPKSFFTVANSYIWGVGNTIGGAAGTALVTALLGLHFTILEAFYLLFALALVSTVLTPLIPKRV
jgi:nitrate/nitrite transporter NarK